VRNQILCHDEKRPDEEFEDVARIIQLPDRRKLRENDDEIGITLPHLFGRLHVVIRVKGNRTDARECIRRLFHVTIDPEEQLQRQKVRGPVEQDDVGFRLRPVRCECVA